MMNCRLTEKRGAACLMHCVSLSTQSGSDAYNTQTLVNQVTVMKDLSYFSNKI